MTRIALLADLHFGSVPEGLAKQLHADLERLTPDLIVIAGDMTLRSRQREFEEAKVWLETLRAPLLLLPGNHDLPVWNLVERFTRPFARYWRSVGHPLMPVFEDEQVVVVGLNTTASWQPTSDGRKARRGGATSRRCGLFSPRPRLRRRASSPRTIR